MWFNPIIVGKGGDMSFLTTISGKQKSEGGGDKGIKVHLDYLNSLRMPAIALSKSGREAFSRIGGLPALPEKVAWPEWKSVPLAFLCQLDLSEIPEKCVQNALPGTGSFTSSTVKSRTHGDSIRRQRKLAGYILIQAAR